MNGVLLHSCITAVAAILNSAALYVIWTRRPLTNMDFLLMHTFVASFIYGVLRFTENLIYIGKSKNNQGGGNKNYDIYPNNNTMGNSHFPLEEIWGSNNTYKNRSSNSANSSTPINASYNMHLRNEYLECAIWLFGIAQLSILTLIASQRFIAVFRPLKAKMWLTKKRTTLTVWLVYVFCVTLTTAIAILHANRLTGREFAIQFYGAVIIGDTSLMFAAYAAVFLKLALPGPQRLESQHRDRQAPQKNNNDKSVALRKNRKFRSCVFSFAITLSNLVSYVPIATQIFGYRFGENFIYIYLLVWLDPIFNPISYILLKRGKLVREFSRSVWKQKQWWPTRKDPYAGNLHVSFKKNISKRNSKKDSSSDEIGITNENIEL